MTPEQIPAVATTMDPVHKRPPSAGQYPLLRGQSEVADGCSYSMIHQPTALNSPLEV